MRIAEQKKEANIAEYILFVWQMEDLLRACQFDLDLLKGSMLDGFVKEEQEKEEALKWFGSLANQLISEGKKRKGHTTDTMEIIAELNYLHNTLSNGKNEESYLKVYNEAKPLIDEFRQKANLASKSEVEICLHALYTKLLLKLKQQPITPETEVAFQLFARLMGRLSKAYKDLRAGNLNFSMN